MTEVVEDATLAQAVADGDQAALAAIYDRYAPQLWGFCTNMLRSRTEAEDCLQDVFVIAATRLAGLREPGALKAWLYSVARHECLKRLDNRRREVLVDAVTDRPDDAAMAPTDDPVEAELAALIADASGGLSDRERLVLELSDRQGLDGDELASALGVPRSTAYTLVNRARATARRSIGALLVARTGRARCPELDAQLASWDGRLTTLRRKQIARHIDNCATCSEQQRRVATPALILGGGWASALPVSLRTRVLAAAADAIATLATAPTDGWRSGWPPSDPSLTGRRRRWLLLGSLPLLLLLVAAGTATVIASGSHRPADDAIPGAPPSSATASVSSANPSPSPTPSEPTTAPGTAAVPSRAGAPPLSTAASTGGSTIPQTPTTNPGTTRVVPPPPSTQPTSAPTRPSTPPRTSQPPSSPPPSTPPTTAPPSYSLVVSPIRTVATVNTRNGRETDVCSDQKSCTIAVDGGDAVSIAVDVPSYFSAPNSCATQFPETSCVFVMGGDLGITITGTQVPG
jgi:RNA polymerase sigma factor (sigma-70 family)